ncbi:MAG TPA: hypothetical protein VGL91_03140 [Acidobacteriota bacterium]|jgi:hypothetical protein
MEESVASYRSIVEEFVEQLTRPYIERLKKSASAPLKVKEINDPVCQTIVLYPFETIVLDAPLLQRLRYIRQLGVAHWVYPGALHTRLEHSVGAVHQVQELLDALSHSARQDKIQEIPVDWQNFLRLAALCHDVGHGFMSHVSENALRKFGVIDELLDKLQDELHTVKRSLSEAAAYFMIGAGAFRELLEFAKSRTGHSLPSNYQTLLQQAIIGGQIHDRYPLIQEIVSGPFDADKLDYMTRDARMAGLPVVTDITRLIRKLRMVEVREDQLPREIARRVKSGHPSYYLFAVALSGGRTLDELMLGRTLLFDKVYRHQKVRGAETMVAKIIQLLVSVLPVEKQAMIPLAFQDDEFLRFSFVVLNERLRTKIQESPQQARIVYDLASRLRDRRLFARAYAFSHNMPLDPFRYEPTQRLGLEKIMRESSIPEIRQELEKAIAQEVARIRKIVPDAFSDEIEDGDLPYYIAIDPPSPRGQGTEEISRAYLVTGDNRLLPFREDSAESSGWSDAYLMARDLGYIFSPEEFIEPVFLASELLLRERFGIRTPSSALYYAKVNNDRLTELRRSLTDKAFYDRHPSELKSEPKRLTRADVASTISKVVENLGSYEGLSTDPQNEKTVRVSHDRVRTWLRQFRTDDEVDAALSLLSAIRVVSRQDLHEAVRHFLEQNKLFKTAFVCPLGSPRDSSAILTYYVGDLVSTYGLTITTLQEALTGENRSILFVDDLISSGDQACTIVLTWMDKAAEAPLDEDHGPPLNPDLKAALLRRQIGFLFIGGEQDGVKKLERTATELGLKCVTHIHMTEMALPRAFVGGAVAYETDKQRERFMERCTIIGHQLLQKVGEKPRDDKWIQDRALGYGNKAYLVVFPYNTPTQTLTLLWCRGKVDDWEWLPLVPRRPKA